MRRTELGPCALALVFAAACGGPDEPSFSPLDVDGANLRDAEGRVVLLRGINARVDGVFDVTFDDGRVALEDVPALTGDDCRRMRALGFNLLRLPVNWSGIEPERDLIDEAYLERVDAAVACAADAGLYVLVDLHQDAYSKHIGEDGAPLWAIVPAPEMLLEGPLEDLAARRTSRQVTRAFESFFDVTDAAGLQAEFRDMLRVVAARYADHPMVIGIELFNEPQGTIDELDAFSALAAEAVREAAPAKLVFFEPPAVRNFTDFQPLASSPFPVAGAVYSPHVYTFIFGPDDTPLQNLQKEDLRASIDNARAEADAWGVPLVIGEFGVGPETTSADAWMAWQSELHDEYLAGNAFWLWKEDSQGRWGVHDHAEGVWTERPQVVGWVSRIQPQRIAGTPTVLRYDAATERMELETTGAGDTAHQIYVPERHADGVVVTCDGSALAPGRAAETGLIEVACDGVLVVEPGS